MQKLVDGIHRFQQNQFRSREQHFRRLVEGQQPLALFITCSDSRIDPSLLTQTEPGELFIMRNAGNIVPPYGDRNGGEAATIEYALAVLKVDHIIICGHSHCGAMNGLLHEEQVAGVPTVKEWLTNAATTARIIQENYGHITEERNRLTAAVEENVLVQLEHLQTHPSVEAALQESRLTLHGWVYQFETGRVFAYDPELGQYRSLSESSTPPPDSTLKRPAI